MVATSSFSLSPACWLDNPSSLVYPFSASQGRFWVRPNFFRCDAKGTFSVIPAKADIQINRGSRDTRALRFETAGWQRQNALKARSLKARSSLCQNRIHPVAGWLWKKPCRTQCKTGLSLKSANKTEIRKMPEKGRKSNGTLRFRSIFKRKDSLRCQLCLYNRPHRRTMQDTHCDWRL